MPILGAIPNQVFVPPSGPGKYGSWRWPIKKTPLFSSNVQTPLNLRNEVRLSNTPYPIWLFEYDFSYLKGAEYLPNSAGNSGLAYVLGFFGAQLGSPGSWLFQDPFDNSVSNELFGWGDGATTSFQLQRSINGQFLDVIQNPNVVSSIAVAGTPLTEISVDGYYIGLENLLQYSTSPGAGGFSTNTAGGASAPTLTPGIAAPDGTTNAYQIAFPATSSGQISSLVQAVPSVAYAAQTFTFSMWLKAASAQTIYFTIADSSPAGVVCQSSAIFVTTTWTRYQVTGSFPSIVIPGYEILVSLGLPQNMSAATVDAWGCQLERNANASGYISTTTEAAIPNGIVTFRQAPPAGSPLTWTGTFWNRCRFDDDQLADLQQSLYQIWELDSLKFRTVILGDE